jgi:hypothetical protein
MKFAIVSLHSHVYQPLADLTWHQNRLLYAIKHGYEPIVKTDDFKGMHLGFAKIALLKEVLDQDRFDAVFWTGADTLITNFNYELDQFIYENKHITIATDFNMIQNDSFIIRNTPESKNYLDMILEKMPVYLSHPYFETGVMVETYPQYEKIIKIVPQKFLNSYPYEIYVKNFGAPNTLDRLGLNGNWTKGDFLIHFPGLNIPTRIKLCQKYLPQVLMD